MRYCRRWIARDSSAIRLGSGASSMILLGTPPEIQSFSHPIPSHGSSPPPSAPPTTRPSQPQHHSRRNPLPRRSVRINFAIGRLELPGAAWTDRDPPALQSIFENWLHFPAGPGVPHHNVSASGRLRSIVNDQKAGSKTEPSSSLGKPVQEPGINPKSATTLNHSFRFNKQALSIVARPLSPTPKTTHKPRQ